MILSSLILVAGIILLFLAVIFDAKGYDYNNVQILAFVGISVIFIGLFSLGTVSSVEPPEKQHEKLLQNIEEANKELQKFYIDHPEFKENN